MLYQSYVSKFFGVAIALGFFFARPDLSAQSNVTVRVMASNLNGNAQTIEAFELRIFQGLKPDIVAIQEFNYANNSPADFRTLLDTAFGTNYVYFRETGSGYNIPNGIISRWPILSSGSWDDVESPNRGFAWAQIDLPGTNELYVVSVHLLTSDSATRATEASNLRALIQANFTNNAWVIVAGDMNTDSRGETAIDIFKTFLSDSPVPTDSVAGGDPDTNANRNKPYDYVLPSFSLASRLTSVVIGSSSFPSGLVFDSRVYPNLADVSPVLLNDSANGQHMAVIKDFVVSVSGTNAPTAPAITAQPQSQVVSPGNNAIFTVTATGSGPLSYQWLFNGTNISGANTNTYTLLNAQFTNAGNYSVFVTNLAGSITSSNALLTVSNQPPTINAPPQSQTVYVGGSATFNVIAFGAVPLSYQWRFNGTNIAGANSNTYTRTNVQINDAGDYTVVVTNLAGAVTSTPPAALAVMVSNQVSVIAQWNFNSITPDGVSSTGSTAPSLGAGTASLVGGTTATFATGDTSLDPAGSSDNTGWNTTAYPASGANNKTAGVQFNVNTAARQNIVVTWSQRASNTGSKYTRLQYTTNGTTFFDFPTAITVGTATAFEARTNSLAAIPNVNNNSNFAFRLVAEFESTAAGTTNANYVGANGAYGTAGTIRFDMVTVSGSDLPTNTPAAPATLNVAANGNGGSQLQLTGTVGVNYVIQSSTNLDANNWLSLVTNSAPFSFADTNTTGAAQKFYRAISLP